MDQYGNRVVSDSSCLYVRVENGKLLGLENGDLADNTDYSFSWRKAYQGQLIIYVRPEDVTKDTIIKVEGENLKAGVIRVNNFTYNHSLNKS